MGVLKDLVAFLMSYPDIAAAVIGLILSWFATQFVKKLLPGALPDDTYRRVIQVAGFVSGWLFTIGAWRLLDPTSMHFERLYYAAGIGFASPALYSLIVPYVSSKWPAIGKALSGRPSEDS